MKHKLILLVAIVLSAFAVSAQNNLQFNRAIFQEISFTSLVASAAYPSTQQTFTVPAGKVWKIESGTSAFRVNSASTPYHSINGNANLLINDKVLYVASANTTGVTQVGSSFPLWLPAGTYTLALEATCGGCAANLTFYGSISGIEFNLAQ